MQDTDARRRGRVRLLWMGLFFALPFVLGWLAYALEWTPGTAGNHGELLAPRPVAGKAFDALKGKWVLVSIDRASCDAFCETKLYYLRQVRKAQGKEQHRVERLWIVLDETAPPTVLLQAIEGTHVVPAADAGALAQFAAQASVTDHVYLLDPLGNLMMRYGRTADPAGMVKDLQRLLKYSALG